MPKQKNGWPSPCGKLHDGELLLCPLLFLITGDSMLARFMVNKNCLYST